MEFPRLFNEVHELLENFDVIRAIYNALAYCGIDSLGNELDLMELARCTLVDMKLTVDEDVDEEGNEKQLGRFVPPRDIMMGPQLMACYSSDLLWAKPLARATLLHELTHALRYRKYLELYPGKPNVTPRSTRDDVCNSAWHRLMAGAAGNQPQLAGAIGVLFQCLLLGGCLNPDPGGLRIVLDLTLHEDYYCGPPLTLSPIRLTDARLVLLLLPGEAEAVQRFEGNHNEQHLHAVPAARKSCFTTPVPPELTEAGWNLLLSYGKCRCEHLEEAALAAMEESDKEAMEDSEEEAMEESEKEAMEAFARV
mmetsp:Transcript_56585/g.104738  ORF Transcript_56585/g.104738 Transcript_56585/m.104738 type:complete len:309 (+) Transcript_56585:34-960(+)